MKIHFIGIGGIGMSALAGISVKEGHKVSGSDKEVQDTTKHLKKIGAKIYIGHKKENIKKDLSLVIYTSAIPKNNPEMIEAKKLKIKMLERAEYLGQLMNNKKGIAVSGTHGKTTTSSMISVILEKAGLDPSVAVGGLIPEIKNQNWKRGKSEYFVAEACEYHSAFLNIKPFISIITNIEEDHLDYFKDINHIKDTFQKFLSQTKQDGFAIICADNIYTEEILKKEGFPFKIYTYGGEDGEGEWKAINIKEEKGAVSFDVSKNNQRLHDFQLSIPGKHNAFNALAAIIVAAELGVSFKVIKEALYAFKGARRRMEVVGEKNDILVIDDYAHHPTEIKSTLEALRNFYSNRGKMWCVYQPHQYSRTKLLFKDFSESFEVPDYVIIPDIYKVRDTKQDIKEVNSKMLVEEMKNHNVNAFYIPTFKEVATYLEENVESGDLLITMGAGPVNEIATLFLNNENRKK
jgi:UDP-N-acetylmuramate--alanine ligase